MKRLKKWWMSCSVKEKIAVLIVLTMMITVSTEGLNGYFSLTVMKKYEKTLKENAVYQELQEVLKKEQETFITYIREKSEEQKQALELACENSKRCITALQFDFEKLGEERYARTWNLVNGYQGYTLRRDQILEETEAGMDEGETLYEVLAIQDHLSNYALKLSQATQKQWNLLYEQQQQRFRMIPFFMVVTVLVVAGCILLCWHTITASMIRPLMLVAEDSRKIAANRFDTPLIRVENEDEIGELVAAFNKMKYSMIQYIHTLKEKNRMARRLHQEELEKLELEKQFERAKLEVLKQQINPHFLFNTLNMISSMAKLEDANVTDKMILSLAHLFRYNLRTVEQEVYLEQELEALDEYVYLQQMRFERIAFEKQIEAEKGTVRIPSFTLQPIVENAFAHGVKRMESGGKIQIAVWMEETNAVIEITDNGCGMEEEELRRLNDRIRKENTSGRGIGLGNICRRINTMYEGGTMQIESEKGAGTTVRLVIPQRQEEE